MHHPPSTLTVTPACDIVNLGPRTRPFAICNRQRTGKDSKASIRCFGSIAKFLAAVMQARHPHCCTRSVAQKLMEPEQLRAWEEARPARLAAYDAQRAAPQAL